jgi:hypothetical protein
LVGLASRRFAEFRGTISGIKFNRVTIGIVVGLLLALVVALVVVPSDPPSRSATAPARTHARVHHPRRASARPAKKESPATFLGPYGVESAAVIAENRLPGTSAWRIQQNGATGSILGFANLDSANVGQSVGLYVSSTSSEFQVTAYRMGWYGGMGARAVWTSPETPGLVQPPCPLTPVVNMVSCDNWTLSLTVPITAAFVSGDYLLKLVGSGGQQSYVQLTIWDPTSTSAYLLMARTFTEEAWNTYGGYSFYQGVGPCPPKSGTYPVCNRARVASLDRPLDDGLSGDFLTNEYPFVEFAEEHGLDVSYVTDLTVDEHPSVLLQHRALISMGHDEAWSNNERSAAVQAQASGVNIAFLGAAGVLRHVRMQASPLGPDREEVDYRNPAEDPLNGQGNPLEVTGNTWSSPPTNWSEVPFVGEEYSGYINPNSPAVPFVVYDASAWIFHGTGLADGSSIPGLIGSDIDHLGVAAQTPPDLQILGHSPVPLTESYTNQGKWGDETYSDMTYYTDPTTKAGVLDVGGSEWVENLAPCTSAQPDCPASIVGKITGNILWLFGQGPAGTLLPSNPNWQSITPAGS